MAENKHDSASDQDIHLPDIRNPEARHEVSDVNVWAVGRFGIALGLLCIVVVALLLGLFRYFLSREEARNPAPPTRGVNLDARTHPPEPRLEETPTVDLARMRAAEDAYLNSYGWIDQRNGIVRIPIDRAIDLLAQRGLPARQAPPPSPVANVTVPTESSLGPKVQQPGGPLANESNDNNKSNDTQK